MAASSTKLFISAATRKQPNACRTACCAKRSFCHRRGVMPDLEHRQQNRLNNWSGTHISHCESASAPCGGYDGGADYYGSSSLCRRPKPLPSAASPASDTSRAGQSSLSDRAPSPLQQCVLSAWIVRPARLRIITAVAWSEDRAGSGLTPKPLGLRLPQAPTGAPR